MNFLKEPLYTKETATEFFSFNGKYGRRSFVSYIGTLLILILIFPFDFTVNLGNNSFTIVTMFAVYLFSLFVVKRVRDMGSPVVLSIFPIISFLSLMSNHSFGGFMGVIFTISFIVLSFSKSEEI